MSDRPGHDPTGDHQNGGDELPDDLTVLGGRLGDALASRAGGEPVAGDAWVAIDAARQNRPAVRVRPIQLVAAAAVVVLVVAVAAVLLRRPDAADVNTGGSSTSSPTSVPVTGVPVASATSMVAATIDGSLVTFDAAEPTRRTLLHQVEPGYEIIDLSVDRSTGELWFTRNRKGTCENEIFRFTPGRAPTFVVKGHSPTVRDAKLAYFPIVTPPRTDACDTTTGPVVPSPASGLFHASWHAGFSDSLVVRDLAAGTDTTIWQAPPQTDLLNGVGQASWTPEGRFVGMESIGTQLYPSQPTNGPAGADAPPAASSAGPVTFADYSSRGIGFRMTAVFAEAQRATATGSVVWVTGADDFARSPWSVDPVPGLEAVRGALALDLSPGNASPSGIAVVTGDYQLLVRLGDGPVRPVDGSFIDAAFWIAGPTTATSTTSTAASSTSSTSTSPTSANPISSTTSVPPSSATSPPSTTTPSTQPFALHGNGVGVADFGATEDATLAAVTAALGSPTEDNAYSGPGLFDFRIRTVRWGNVVLLFAERNGGHEFAGWSYDSQYGTQVVPMPNKLTLGLSVAQLQAQAPPPVTAEGLEGSTGLCFPDAGSRICAALDPPWQKVGEPTSGTVTTYLAGLFTA